MQTLTAAFLERLNNLEELLKKLKEQATPHVETGKISEATLARFNAAEMQLAACRVRLTANQYNDAVYLFSRLRMHGRVHRSLRSRDPAVNTPSILVKEGVRKPSNEGEVLCPLPKPRI